MALLIELWHVLVFSNRIIDKVMLSKGQRVSNYCWTWSNATSCARNVYLECEYRLLNSYSAASLTFKVSCSCYLNKLILVILSVMTCLMNPIWNQKRGKCMRKEIYLESASNFVLPISVVECRTRNRVSPGSNPPLLPFRRLGIFVLSIVVPVDSAL